MASENKKIKNATPLDYKGIHFKSILEVSIFKVLEENNLEPHYEEYTYELISGWKPKIPFYRKNKKTKLLTLENKKIISIKYDVANNELEKFDDYKHEIDDYYASIMARHA